MRTILFLFFILFALKITAQVPPPPPPPPGDTSIAMSPEVMPQFPGGDDSLNLYIARHIKYPPMCVENGVSGTVWVSFVVDKTGAVKDVMVLKGVDKCNMLDKEALRVVSGMPNWYPGKMNGRAINCTMTLPVKFVIR